MNRVLIERSWDGAERLVTVDPDGFITMERPLPDGLEGSGWRTVEPWYEDGRGGEISECEPEPFPVSFVGDARPDDESAVRQAREAGVPAVSVLAANRGDGRWVFTFALEHPYGQEPLEGFTWLEPFGPTE